MELIYYIIDISLTFWIMFLETVSSDGRISAEHRLYNKLFQDYNVNIRPVRDEANSVQVTLDFNVQHLDNLDAQKQLLQLSGWLEVEWIDEYLSWNESEYGNVDMIVVPPQKVWLPSFALDNSAGDVYDLMHYNYFRVAIYSDGTVWWEPGGKYECVCTMDITYYPFDNQVCQLVFTNWVYIGRQVNLTIGRDSINLEKFPGNGEWNIVKTEAVRHEETYFCCPEIMYPEIHFVLYMQRKSLYYVINVLLPVLMLSLLELLIFILPCDSGEKISLGITIMLGFSVFALLIEESVPNTSEATPIIVIYLTCAMGTATVSVISSVCILATHHHRNDIRPPRCLRRLKALPFETCKHFVKAEKPRTKRRRQTSDYRNNELVTTNHKRPGSKKVKVSPLELKIDDDDVEKQNTNHNEIGNNVHASAANNTHYESSSQEQLNRTLQDLLAKYEDDAVKQEISEEWRTVAKALDRILFVIVSVSLITIACVILGLVPLSKSWPNMDYLLTSNTTTNGRKWPSWFTGETK